MSLDSAEVVLAFPKEAGFHLSTINGSGRAVVEKALAEHFGGPMRVVTKSTGEVLTATGPSLAEVEAQAKATREHDLDAKIRKHPAVLSVLRTIGGEIEHIQVLEAERTSNPEPDDPS